MALDMVGLSHRLRHRTGQMSGGEQQRVGIVTLAASFTLVMGVLGGVLPGMSAMRIKPLEALR